MPFSRSSIARSASRAERKSCFTAVVLVVVAVSDVSSQQLLQWKLAPDQQIDVLLKQSTDTEQVLMGQRMKSHAEMSMEMNWAIRSVAVDGVAEIAQTVENVAMKLASPGSPEISFDTSQQSQADGTGKMLCEHVQPLIGLTVLQKMNPSGEILDARLTMESEQQLRAVPAGRDVKKLFSKEDIQSLVAQSAAVLPKHPVRPGETWENTIRSPSPVGDMLTTMRYSYRGTMKQQQRTLEQIDVEVSVQMPPGDSKRMSVEISQQQSRGTMWFDSNAGMFVRSSLQQDLTLQSKMGESTQEYKLATTMQVQFHPVRSGSAKSGSDRVPIRTTSTRK
jgi:hypothetical protein